MIFLDIFLKKAAAVFTNVLILINKELYTRTSVVIVTRSFALHHSRGRYLFERKETTLEEMNARSTLSGRTYNATKQSKITKIRTNCVQIQQQQRRRRRVIVKVNAGLTMYDKIVRDHTVTTEENGTKLLFIDRHMVHEVTSPQAFEALRLAGRNVRRPDNTLATVDHNVPTSDRSKFEKVETFIVEMESRVQVLQMEENVKDFGITYFGMDDKRQGIVHIIGPEQGFTLPGTTVVCGDSHTATHGAFGALAFGIGTSEVEHVLATQTLLQKPSMNMNVRIDGKLMDGVTSKDLILHVIGKIGTAGGNGSVIEFSGEAIRELDRKSVV